MTTTTGFETPKRELLVFYYKYRRRLVLAFLLPFLVSVVLSFVPQPHYEAESTLVVRLGSEYVYQPEGTSATSGAPTPIPFDRDQIYKAEVAILGSNDLHEQVIQAIGIDRIYPPQAPGFSSKISTPMRQWLLGVIDSWFPDDAATGTLASAASDLRVALQNTDADLTPEQKAHKRLEKAVAMFDKNLKINLEKESAVISLTFQHRNRDVAISALDNLLKLYLEKRKQLYLDTRGTLAKSQAETMHQRVNGLQAAMENFKREHKIYSLADQRSQLLQQREEVRKQMMTVSNVALEDKLNNITEQLDALDALERQSNALDQELKVAEDEYTLYVHKLDDAQSYDSQERAQAGSVRVIQPPAAPPEPKRLQSLIIIAGFMLSLIFTALVAAITEFSRSGFLTPERLERNIGLPILCALPLRK